MKVRSSIATCVAVIVVCTVVQNAHAQRAPDTTISRQQKTLDSLTAAVRAMQARLDSVSTAADAAPPALVAPVAPVRTAGAYMNASFVGLSAAGWSSANDIPALQLGDHDPRVRGFTIPNGELVLDGAVDPYFKGFANIVYKLDAKGETGVELEEMYFVSTSLKHNLQLKGGQYFLDFGRQNIQHPHAWAFVDEPLVLSRMMGGEGFRSQGLRLSWLLPTPFYTEAMLSVANSVGTTTSSFRSDESPNIHGGALIDRGVNGLSDLLYVPRLATSFDLTETQTIVVGTSAALGPNNSGVDANSALYGADLYWKWKSPTASAGFPFVSFQTEVMSRRYDAAARAAASDLRVILPTETLHDHGMYAQLVWGIKPMIVAGFRGEFASGDNAAYQSTLRADRYRYSPNVTWFPTEFSKIRLQYNYDHRTGIGVDHSLWMQFEYLLGSHAAHKF